MTLSGTGLYIRDLCYPTSLFFQTSVEIPRVCVCVCVCVCVYVCVYVCMWGRKKRKKKSRLTVPSSVVCSLRFHMKRSPLMKFSALVSVAHSPLRPTVRHFGQQVGVSVLHC
jgi:hypothetical protein